MFNKLLRFLGLEKGFVSVAGGNTIASITGALFWLFLASFMPTEEYGELHYYLSIAFLFSALSILGLGTTVTTFLAKGEEKIKFQANLLVIFTNIIIMILLYIFINNLVVMFLLMGLSFFIMTQAEYLGKKQYKNFAYVVIFQRVLNVGLSLGLYYLIGVNGILIGYTISTILFSYNFFRSIRGFEFNFTQLKGKSSFMIHSFSLNISGNVANNVDKLLIAPLFGFAILGLYQIGFQFVAFLSIIPLSLFQYLLPQEASTDQKQRGTKKALIFAGLITGFFIFLIPIIIPQFFPNFIESILVSQIIVLGIIPMTASAIMQSRLFGKEKSKIVFVSAGVRISSLLILIVYLGGIFDLIGLGFAILISLILESICLFVISKLTSSNKRPREVG